MKISNLIIELQKSLNQTSDPQTLMIAAKAIEKLKIDQINVINSFHQLPALPMTSDGNVYLNENSEELYYNLGNDWLVFPATLGNFAMSWGSNFNGQLGDNTSITRSSPVSVVGKINNWIQISAGRTHAHGIDSNGVAWSWGNNGAGQLGINQVNGTGSPVSIGGITNWSQVSAGSLHSLGIANGVAWAWGVNGGGQLGDGSTTIRSSPVSVIGGITNWSQVSAGINHSLGIANGVAWVWGGPNSVGELGDGTTTSRTSPASVIGGITNWQQVSAGFSHSLGITTSGQAWGWGENFSGEIGDGTTSTKTSPVSVVGGITNWSQVSAGSQHSLGIANGVAWAWGSNYQGILGNGNTDDKSSPVSVIGGITNWSQVSAGNNHSLGIASDGVSWSWGRNQYGQLGNLSLANRSSPGSVSGGITNWTQISAGKNGDWSMGITTDRVKA